MTGSSWNCLWELPISAADYGTAYSNYNIKTWTGLPVEESIRLTEDRGKWRKYVNGVAHPRIEDS